MTQKTFEDVLADWEVAKREAKKWVETEKHLRLALFAGAVPTPKEGINNVELADGRVCKFTYPMNRKVSEPVTLLQKLVALGVNNTDQLLRVKYELVKAGFMSATGDTRKVLDEHVTTTPGTPSLEVV